MSIKLKYKIEIGKILLTLFFKDKTQRALDRIVFNQSILEQNKLWDE